MFVKVSWYFGRTNCFMGKLLKHGLLSQCLMIHRRKTHESDADAGSPLQVLVVSQLYPKC